MTDLVVVRFLGDKEGDDIIDELLSTDAAALSRGRAELDFQSTAQVQRSLEIPYEAGLSNGQMVEVTDELQGETYYGKITGLDYRNELAQATVVMSLIVPSDFYT